jgi:RNA-directed DNA polymerase
LDATTTLELTSPDTARVGEGCDAVNGPEGRGFDWGAVAWRTAENEVRRLRQRIFAASQAGDLKKVRNLPKLMVRHEARVYRMGVKDRRRLIVVAVG